MMKYQFEARAIVKWGSFTWISWSLHGDLMMEKVYVREGKALALFTSHGKLRKVNISVAKYIAWSIV